MTFEFDHRKSSANRSKHGIDFVDAQAIWRDPDRMEIAARSTDEPRWQVIGLVGRTVWSALSPIAMNGFASSRSGGRGRKREQGTSISEKSSAARLDELHDAGADMTPHLDLDRARRPGRETRRVNVDFPVDLLSEIDREARKLGVTRQAFIKLRLADTLSSHRSDRR